MQLIKEQLRRGTDIYEVRVWRKWANMDDVILWFDNEIEAKAQVPTMYTLAVKGDTITIIHRSDWVGKKLFREVVS